MEEAENEGMNNAVSDFEEDETPKQKKRVKKTKQIPVPKDSASWFRARAKDPRMFEFTADGNLAVPEMRGQAAKVIELPAYRQATVPEMLEGEEKRRDELVGIEREYDETMRQYKEAIQEWRDTGKVSDVLKYQRDLTRLDAMRTRLRSPVLWTQEFKRLSIRDVLVDEFYQVKKLGYSVFALKMRSVPWEEVVRIGSEAPEAPQVAEEEEDQEEESFIFFNNPDETDYGALSPDTMVEFVYNSTKYNCPTQAYEAERLQTIGRKDIRTLLLRQRNPVTMRALSAKVIGDVENPRELWIGILKALVSQHPRFMDVLRSTEKDTLVYANPKEGRWGIGMSEDDPLATEKSSWKGPNVLGQAWEVVRESVGEVQTGGDHEQGTTYTEHGKTKEESKEIHRNILKGYYKKMKQFQ